MSIHLYMIGKFKNRYLDALSGDFIERIRRFHPCRISSLKESRYRDEKRYSHQIVEEEAEVFLKKISPGEYVVLLDKGGRQMDSIRFSRFLEQRLIQEHREMAFFIGGFLGVSRRIREKADTIVSLSTLTMTHEMAVLVLAEQLFRALTIIKKIPYHK